MIKTIAKTKKGIIPLQNLYNNSHFSTKKIVINAKDEIYTKLKTIESFLIFNQIPPLAINTMNLIKNTNTLYAFHDTLFNRTFNNLDMFTGFISLQKKVIFDPSIKSLFDLKNYNSLYPYMNMSFSDPCFKRIPFFFL